MEKVFECILKEEERIRERLTEKKRVVMNWKDWENYRKATVCLICEESLMVDEYLDSVPVYTIGEDREEYFGQCHKKCFWTNQKNREEEGMARQK